MRVIIVPLSNDLNMWLCMAISAVSKEYFVVDRLVGKGYNATGDSLYNLFYEYGNKSARRWNN